MGKIKGLGNWIKQKAKYLLGVFAIAAILSPVIFGTGKINANGPKFNFMDGDYSLIRGANDTKGETVWKNPLSGNAGDTFKGIIYYHNGMLDTSAHDTVVKINLPSQTTNKSAVINATLLAENADSASGNLNVNLDQDAQISLVPNSTVWYRPNPDIDIDSPNHMSAVSLPDSITSSGVNIGDVNGCWNYAGYVVFAFKTSIKPIMTVNIVKNKSAVDLTSGVSALPTTEGGRIMKSTSARPGDEIEYTLSTQNSGNAVAENYVIADGINDVLEESNIVSISDGGQVVSGTSGDDARLVSWPAVNIAPGQTVVRKFVVKVMSPLPTNPTVGNDYDHNLYNAYGDIVLIRITTLVAPAPVATTKTTLPTTGDASVIVSGISAAMAGIFTFSKKIRIFKP